MKVGIEDQIAEVKRELALRTNTYPRLIEAGKMHWQAAEQFTARMQAVLATLAFCQANEAEIRAFIRERRERPGGASSMTPASSTSKT
jgi:hypothetical protein